MKQLLLLCLLVIGVAGSGSAQNKDEAAIRGILERQSHDWNNGKLEGFMNGYWASDSLLFIGKKGVTYGWQQALDNYKSGYPDTAAMGKLNFNIIQVKRLSVQYFFVVGKWHLTRTVGDLEGAFTLLFKKIKGQWVIVADHSS